MESLIAKLLGDFEAGKLSRRQLIQSLALCATAPAAAAAAAAQAPAASAAPAAGTPAPWKTVYLDHISYAVADYKKSAAFYSSLMGWTIRNDNGTSQATLDIGNVGGIIIRNARKYRIERLVGQHLQRAFRSRCGDVRIRGRKRNEDVARIVRGGRAHSGESKSRTPRQPFHLMR